jgi:hypothetical protein
MIGVAGTKGTKDGKIWILTCHIGKIMSHKEEYRAQSKDTKTCDIGLTIVLSEYRIEY